MIRLAQINVLAARRCGQSRRQLSPDKRATHRDQAAQNPDAQNQEWRMDAVRDLGRIREDSRPDDASHHDHRRVEQSEPPARSRASCHSERSRGIPWLSAQVALRDVSTFARHDD